MSPVNKPPVASLSGTNLEFARSHNRRVVMEAIRLHGRLTRADIARLTALTPQTISNIASELQKLGFLNALTPERGTRGQPATPFVINPDGAYSIGLQIDQNMMVAVVVDLSGKIRGRCTLAVDHPTPAQALPLVRDVVETLRKSSDADWSRVLGLGLAVPGPFDVEGLSAVGPTALPGWQDLSIAQQIGTRHRHAGDHGERRHRRRHRRAPARRRAHVPQLHLPVHRHRPGRRHVPRRPPVQGLGPQRRRDRPHDRRAGRPRRARAATAAAWSATCRCRPPTRRWRSATSRTPRRRCCSTRAPPRARAWTAGSTRPRSGCARPSTSSSRCSTPRPWSSAASCRRRCWRLLIERLEPLHTSVAARRNRQTPRVIAGLAGHDTAALGAAALPIFDELNPNLGVLLKADSA